MKKNHWIALITGIVIALGIYAIPAITQQPAAPQAQPVPTRVAIVDLAQIIKMHPNFIKEQTAFKGQVEESEKKFQKRQEEIIDKQKALETSGLQPGSPAYQQELDKITGEVSDFKKDAEVQQRKFILQNSQIMYDTFMDIRNTISRIAAVSGIAQVTDYRDIPVNPAIPETVAEEMDQRVVWFNPSLNITRAVIEQLYKDRGIPVPSAPLAGAAAATPTVPNPNPNAYGSTVPNAPSVGVGGVTNQPRL